ncbi:hypothetical protein V8F33_002720 [Rhypophila sp. PSN 637]
MVGRKRSAPGSGGESSRRTTRASASSQSSPLAPSSTSRRTRASRTAGTRNGPPDIYREMIQESRRARAVAPAPAPTPQNGEPSSEPPLKRRRPGERPPPKVAEPKQANESESQELVNSTTSKLKIMDKNAKNEKRVLPHDEDDEDDDDIEFEDVVIPAPTIQTMIQESDDEDDDNIIFEDVDIDAGGPSTQMDDDQPLELNLTAQKAVMNPRRTVDRRKAISNEEKRRRVEIHKAHLLCLLSHVERRNRWCNDPEVQAALRPLLTDKMMRALHPRTNQPQFGRSEALKAGIQEARTMFNIKFTITERGLKRSLWAEDAELLKDYQLPEDIESVHEKADFLEAAKSLSGSRDVGAQLFCALLRSAGLEARLVCSLQPLPCVPGGGPPMPKPNASKSTPSKPSRSEMYAAVLAQHESKQERSFSSPRSRLGHPNATAYHIPTIEPFPSSSFQPPKVKKIRGESSYPIYWIEILDEAYQKYNPVDPLVTCTQWRPKALEPPATIPGEKILNSMTYVIAFGSDSSAKDVTRRYVKAYNSKTKRFRIDGPIASRINSSIHGLVPMTGEKWWRKALRRYNPLRFREPTPLEQIEANELAAYEAKEPMPRNVADFKDHPVYALERHLRRSEVLVKDAQYTGTVSAGKSGGLEKIYRRKDVRLAQSRDKWFRLGRLVQDLEEPVKILPPNKKKKRSVWDDEPPDNNNNKPFGDGEEEEEEDPEMVGLFGDALVIAGGGIPIYTEEQTTLYVPPPVGEDGRIPKNKFGNIEVFVPSMVPQGGVHVDHPRAAQASYILGVDYAPALTGWKFAGKKGTAVLQGVVVAKQVEEGVRAVIGGLEDLDAEIERERRAKRALRMWGRWVKALRIRERVWANTEGGGGLGEVELPDEEEEEEEPVEKEKEEEGGGGFMTQEYDGGGGGFVLDERHGQDDDDQPPTKQLSRQNPAKPSSTAPQGPAVTKDGLPINWPSETKYLTAPSYSKFVTCSQLDMIRKPPPAPSSSSSTSSVPLPCLEPVTGENDIIPLGFPSGPSPAVQIHRITDPNHPAYGQCGLFAARDLLPGELILPYYGVVHPGVVQVDTVTEQPKREDDQSASSPDDPVGGENDQLDKSIQALSLRPEEAPLTEEEREREKERIQHEKSDYDLWLSREADLAVDGETMGNEARFINDYRGVPGKERENAELRLVWDERIGEWTMAVYKVTAGGGLVPSKMSSVGVIRKGEEILVSYGRGFWERRKEEGL